MAILSYRDRGSLDVARGINSKAARRVLPIGLHEVARRRLAFLSAGSSLDDLRSRAGLNLHALTQDRIGQYAIRVNEQYRICFLWKAPDASDVQIGDYH